jgi:membrane associated rhomboid family serine protease
MIQASVGFHCPECAKQGKQKVYTARTLPGMASGSIVTMVLIGINVAVFVLGLVLSPGSLMDGSQKLLEDGGLVAGGAVRGGPLGYHLVGVAHGEWWRIITSGFLHFGLIHLALNMWALYIIGPVVERAVGKSGLLTIYGSSLVAGSLGGLIATPNALGAGASGAIFGLMGALLVGQKASGISVVQGGLLPVIVINIVFTFAIPGISVGAHLGGLAGGILAGGAIFYGPRYARSRLVPNLVGGAVGVVSFVACLLIAPSLARI